MVSINKLKFRSVLSLLTIFISFAVLAVSAVHAQNSAPQADLQRLKAEIRRLLISGEYNQVIEQLTVLRASDNIAVSKFSQEFLGVTREKMEQPVFAKAEYERFLANYGNEPEANRVRQRLASLLGSDQFKVPEKTKQVAARPIRKQPSSTRGSLGLDYRASENEGDDGEKQKTLSMLASDLDVRSKYVKDNDEFGLRLSLGHYEDLLNEGNNTTDRIRYSYFEYIKDDKFALRLGRQRSNKGALIGRFDGLDMGYQFESGPGVSFFAGLPVESSKNDLFSDDRQFVGVSIDSGNIWESTKLGFYGLHQTINGIVDRQTVGADLRYMGDGLMLRGLVDYDAHFRQVNALLLNFNAVNAEQTSLHFSYNFRKSPFLSTRNALIGQRLDSIEELQNLLLTDDQIEDLALDRSLDSQTVNVGYSKRVTSKVTVSGSVSWLSLGEGVSSGGLIATPGTDQVYGDIRFVFNDFLTDQNSLTLGVRYADQENADVVSLILASRYRKRSNWSFSPRLRMDKRDNLDGSEQINLAPGIRLEYQNNSHLLFLDTGYLIYRTKYPQFGDREFKILYSYIGYRYRF